jgi:putative DNA primase/helicase
MATRQPIDFGGLAAALLQRVDTLLPQWLPNGIERNGRWYVGDFDGSPGESANVNMQTGQWIDNAAPDEDKGGDLISLYARIRGLNNGQAALELMRQMGWTRPDEEDRVQAPAHVQRPAESSATGEAPAPDHAEERPASVPASRKSKWRALPVVPPNAPQPSFRFGYKDKRNGGAWVELDAVKTWEYQFEGERLGYVARFERISSDGELVKDTVPLTWCVDESDGRGLQRWHWKQWEAPRPLYVPASILAGDPATIPVVLVEGEKCAEAGFKLIGHEFDFVTWPGGCKAWAQAHWGWLMGRTVYLWPDCDAQHERLTKAEREAGVDPKTKPLRPAEKQPGLAAMVAIGQLLQADYGCTVFLCGIPQPGTVADGWDVADAIVDGWDAVAVRDFIRAAHPFVAPSDEARAKSLGISTASKAAAEKDEDAPDTWRSFLLTTGQGAIKPARENVVLALDGIPEKGIPGVLEAAGLIAYNEFTNDVIKLKDAPWGTPAGVWDEVDELELGNWLTREHWLPPMSRQTLEEAVTMVARRHRHHPAREHFQSLQGKWDGERRLASWLVRCVRKPGDVEPQSDLDRYLSRVGTWMVMAICARVLTPGCKFDYMPILEGGQGLGKSTLARLLGMDWFADTGLVLGDKDSYQNLQGVLVYEWGELDSLTRAEVTKVKQFISSMKDRFRASFDRRAKDYPRQVVFIGTTNESHYLSDPTGNRRMWPIRCTRQIDLAWLRDNIDQLFAEALYHLEAGDRFHPTPKEQRDLFDPQQMERTIESSLESAIRRYLYDTGQKITMNGVNGSLVDEVSLADLLSAIGITIDKQTQVLAKQASSALGRLGWERSRGHARKNDEQRMVRPWVYVRPKESDGGEPPAGMDSMGDAAHQPEGADSDCPF